MPGAPAKRFPIVVKRPIRRQRDVVAYLSTVLALGGSFWCVVLLPTFFWNTQAAIFILGPGYVMTLWYILRACSRQFAAIGPLAWPLSFLLQISWFVLIGGTSSSADVLEGWFIYARWLSAAMSSAVAFFIDMDH